MPKKARELSAIEVKRLSKQPGFHSVGGVAGLHLNVSDTLAASWILRVKVGDRRPDLGLGGFPDVPLAEAREKAREKRSQIARGIDPREAKRAAKQALKAAQAKAMTFDEAAKACHEAKAGEFSNEKHKADWISSLQRYASAIVGSMPVAEVELAHVVRILSPIWSEKPETASRLRQRIEAVLNWAKVSGYRQGENPARWQGNLEHALAKVSRRKRVEHYPALPPKDVPGFMVELRKREGVAARALEFAILTASRSGEVRGATWDEIDLTEKVWIVPAERMKGRRQHRVPLSDAAVKLLKAQPRTLSLVFPSPRNGERLSDMSILKVVRSMGVPVVPHGFRSSFKDWARSCTSYPDEISELALAHVSTDATRAAYARDELMEKRQRLMRDWAKYCETMPTKGTVVPLRRA